MPKPYSGNLRARVIERNCNRSLAARGGRTLWDQRQCGGDLGAAVRRNWERRGKTEWRQHIAAGRACGISGKRNTQTAIRVRNGDVSMTISLTSFPLR